MSEAPLVEREAPTEAKTPLKVLLVTHYYAEHRGGVEIVAGELASRLAARGVQIEWAASRPTPANLHDGVRPLGMHACNFTERRLGFPYPVWGPLCLFNLSRAVSRADLVHLHDSLYLGNALAYFWARWKKKPVVVTQHIGEVPYSRRLLRWLLRTANHTLGRMVLGGSTQAVFIADKVQAYFAQFTNFRTPPLLIPNGVDRLLFSPIDEAARQSLREELDLDPARPVLLFVGRFVEKKGLHLLRELATRFNNCQWVFVGWGPEDPRWGLTQVRNVGMVEHCDLTRYYQAADLLVLPSAGEGFPLVVQEAMACGTPALISADTARGSAGVERAALVCELDTLGLAACLESFLAKPETWPAHRTIAAEYARQHWDWDACAAQYYALFERLAAAQAAKS